MTTKHVLFGILALTLAFSSGCGPKPSEPQANTSPSAPVPSNSAPAPEAPPDNPDAPPPSTAAASPPPAGTSDASDGPGVTVGETVSVELKDQSGKIRTLPELAGEGLVALVFHRSADW